MELGKHCMEGLEPDWVEKVTPGQNLMVAGRNFGCGSSREHAPVAILGAGMNVVVAHSFARIFYRNAFNMGLLPIELGDDVADFKEGDEVEVDMEAGTVTNKSTGKSVKFPPLPETMRAILEAGGLAEFVKKRLNA
jgi:3-isopropylmalate/(R)-2-methylmalate dehydratase small subunit